MGCTRDLLVSFIMELGEEEYCQDGEEQEHGIEEDESGDGKPGQIYQKCQFQSSMYTCSQKRTA